MEKIDPIERIRRSASDQQVCASEILLVVTIAYDGPTRRGHFWIMLCIHGQSSRSGKDSPGANIDGRTFNPSIDAPNGRIRGELFSRNRILLCHRVTEISNPRNSSQAMQGEADQMSGGNGISGPDYLGVIFAD